jgi:hypothetical protein
MWQANSSALLLLLLLLRCSSVSTAWGVVSCCFSSDISSSDQTAL